MQNRTAAYLEAMGNEPAARREARRALNARFHGIEWRWEQRAQLRQKKTGTPNARVERRGGVIHIHRRRGAADEPLAFLRRFWHVPSVWDAYGRAIAATGSRHRSGRRWAKLRRAHVSLWIELLVRGRVTPTSAAEGDDAAGFAAYSRKNYERMLRERSEADAPFALDGARGAFHVWSRPHALSGPPKPEEVQARFEDEARGFLTPPLRMGPNSLVIGREALTLYPSFVRSVCTLRDDLLTRLDPLVEDEETRVVAEVLRDDLRHRWWPLRALHVAISQDTALAWWLARSPTGRAALLKGNPPPRVTRRTFRQIILIHRSTRHAPLPSADAVAMSMLADAHSLHWRKDAAATARARLAAVDAAMEAGGLTSRARLALLLDAAEAWRAMGEPRRTERVLREAGRVRLPPSAPHLRALLREVQQGKTVRIRGSSLGGGTGSEMLGLRE